jgi:hypothetical protein
MYLHSHLDIGKPHLDHSSQRALRQLCDRLSPLPNQPWLLSSLQRDYLPRRRRPPNLLHRLHRLPASKAVARRASPGRTLEPGQVRLDHRDHRHSLPRRHLGLLLLPTDEGSHHPDHELGLGHLFRRHYVSSGLLLCVC